MEEKFTGNVRAIAERSTWAWPGWVGLIINLGIEALTIVWFINSLPPDRFSDPNIFGIIASTVVFSLSMVLWNGMFIVQPNQAEVLVLFGRYLGSVKKDGWYFTNPLVSKRRISLRVHNFNSPQLKVNDADGNPIEIAAVVVWRVVDTARASFDVENYTQFVEVQSETAIRHLASQYPYDEGQHPGQPSLRGAADEVAVALRKELQVRLDLAGIEVLEARLSHLAYSPEIAGAMLQRQQASAIIAARQRIVEGAVGMVEMALEMLAQKEVVALTPEKKADLVSNLLVVLTSERGAHPMLPINNG